MYYRVALAYNDLHHEIGKPRTHLGRHAAAKTKCTLVSQMRDERTRCPAWRNDDPGAVKDSGVVAAESNQDQCHVGITERRQRHTSWRLSLAMRRAQSARSESPVPDK